MSAGAAISARTRLGVVIGDPVDHSLSPALHNAAFEALGVDAVFVAMRVERGHVAAAITALQQANALGASITVPHKTAVIERCDALAPSARAAGAVNCIELASDKVVGHNTDASGFVAALREAGHDRGWRPLILGGGGAARAVAAGLDAAGSEPATIIARDPARVEWTAARPWSLDVLRECLPAHDLVIDCTSAGLSSAGEKALPAPLELDRCAADAVICSLVYHRETALLADARRRGLATVDGLGMLVHQALAALEIWLGDAPAADVLWSAARAAT